MKIVGSGSFTVPLNLSCETEVVYTYLRNTKVELKLSRKTGNSVYQDLVYVSDDHGYPQWTNSGRQFKRRTRATATGSISRRTATLKVEVPVYGCSDAGIYKCTLTGETNGVVLDPSPTATSSLIIVDAIQMTGFETTKLVGSGPFTLTCKGGDSHCQTHVVLMMSRITSNSESGGVYQDLVSIRTGHEEPRWHSAGMQFKTKTGANATGHISQWTSKLTVDVPEYDRSDAGVYKCTFTGVANDVVLDPSPTATRNLTIVDGIRMTGFETLKTVGSGPLNLTCEAPSAAAPAHVVFTISRNSEPGGVYEDLVSITAGYTAPQWTGSGITFKTRTGATATGHVSGKTSRLTVEVPDYDCSDAGVYKCTLIGVKNGVVLNPSPTATSSLTIEKATVQEQMILSTDSPLNSFNAQVSQALALPSSVEPTSTLATAAVSPPAVIQSTASTGDKTGSGSKWERGIVQDTIEPKPKRAKQARKMKELKEYLEERDKMFLQTIKAMVEKHNSLLEKLIAKL
ncbi:hypothetical protein ScPMuIL_002822 [Solemya velum]